MVFYFSGNYDSGEQTETEEGKLEWLHKDDIPREQLIPAIQEIIDHILDPSDGTVFARFEYTDTMVINQETKQIKVCAV